MRVLLAEDTPSSQEIIKIALGRRGHCVTIAENGIEAIDHARRGEFDVMLMDLHMPIMDGLTAARGIREHERSTGSRLPIVAVTARSTVDVRLQCDDAGIDAFLSKPIDMATLVSLVESFGNTTDGDGAARHSDSADGAPKESMLEPDSKVFDYDAALARMGDDPALFQNLLQVFLEDYPTLISQAQSGLENGDAHAVRIAAHSLKGLFGHFSAHEATGLASQIENAAQAGDLNAAAGLIDSLERAALRLRGALVVKWKSMDDRADGSS